ncbi:white collar 2 type of transcription factor [Oleoguttula sp. CCFEE 5521]
MYPQHGQQQHHPGVGQSQNAFRRHQTIPTRRIGDGEQHADGHLQLAGGPGLSLDQSADLMGFDMDLSLPMDLDLDLANSNALAGNDPSSLHNLGAAGSNALASQNMGGLHIPQLQQQQDVPTTGAGAGPLPAGFGLMPIASTSTLTEFTKRRNWSQRVIEELKDLLHILTPDGRILYVSPSCRALTGHEPASIIGKFMGEYVHPDDSGIFMREFNESIASGNPLRFFYRFKKEDGDYMIFECDGHPHITPGEHSGNQPSTYGQSPIQQSQMASPGICRGFFMMARPYPTKNAALLDSFLEHKIENERLMKRIEELKREEADETAEQDRLYREQISGSATGATSEVPSRNPDDQLNRTPVAQPTPNYQGMPPPAKPTISNTALTRQNLDSALSAQRPDSIADKMSRYEANSNHLESIELLTGLRYRDGERSHGISTGDTSPALIRGDAGIAILLDRDRESNKKEKKKLKVADEYVCADCGTLDSPEWRKGPKGPKTLCNACGLRWAKKEKKRSGVGDDGLDDEMGMATPLSGQAAFGGQPPMGNVGMQPPLPIGLPRHQSSGSMSQ